MDASIMIVSGLVAVGLVWFFFFRDPDQEANVTTKPVEPVSKPAPAPEKKAKLPSKAELDKLTKAKLEELGRELGVELDKRKTKANMITDLKKAAK